jgi:CelD/BcsL family acetyltransferase involved in cellulose biosynthesis
MKRQEVVKVLREAAGNMLPHGLFRLYILYLDSRPAATLYGFVDPPAGRSGERDASRTARTFYYYLGGFDPKFNPVSPGTLLIGHAMEQAAGEGCAVFDFLRGRDRYKYLWGARDSATWCRVLKHGHGDGI